MPHDVFLSYSSKDKVAADAVCNVLERNRIRVWTAPRDVMPGVGWAASIIGAINGARVMVLVFSSHANASPQIEREVERAINKGIPVIPFRMENIEPSPALEYFISSPHWLDAFTPPFEDHLERLADAVKRLLESEFARVTPQERRRNLGDERGRLEAEAARHAQDEQREREEAEALRQAEEERQKQEEAAAARRAEEGQRQQAEAARKAEEVWREVEDARLADEARERRAAAQRMEEELLRMEAEEERGRQMAAPDMAPELLEAARPMPVLDSETLPGIPQSGANRANDPENARSPSQPAPNWRMLSAISGLALTAAVATVVLITKDSGHNGSTPLSGSSLPVTQNGNASSAVAFPTPAPVTDCDRLAAGVYDPDRISGVDGVLSSDQINVDLALPACLSATKSYPAERRLAYQLGRVLYAAKRFEEARKVLVDANNAGSTSAKTLLGGMCENGQGVAKDEALAVELYSQAADLGNSAAMNNLGLMYEDGRGVAKDEAEAVRLFSQAADLGNSKAMTNLGRNYENGGGVAKDAAAAVRLYSQAADLGDSFAMYNLGWSYEHGDGVTKDLAKAQSYYQMAADRGDLDAKAALQQISAPPEKK